MLAFGSGTSKNEALALEYYRRAADQGHVKAQGSVGYLLLKRNELGMIYFQSAQMAEVGFSC